MFNLLLILQEQPRIGDGVHALENLNALVFAFFFVGIMLMLLITAHWYRMKDKLSRSERMQRRDRESDGYDPVSQMQFMTRNELKTMILKEREEKTAPKPNADDVPAHDAPPDALDPFDEETWEISDETVLKETDKVESTESVRNPELPDLKTQSEAEILAKLVMPVDKDAEEEEEKKKPAKEPVNPYQDKIKRSALSSELPEEFRKKSRRI